MNRGPADPYRFVPDELHPSIQDKLVGRGNFVYLNADYEYGILDPSAAPIHNVVGMRNGQNLIASSAIPPELLPMYLGHEIQCNRLRAGEAGRCASVESGIIEGADPKIVEMLLTARMKTFEDLVALYGIDVENPEGDFYKEIAGTTKLLRSKIAAMKLS